ncbi:hypothetical protein [Arthrobacter sp. AFG20]|nr:hypothetical protein [Arthrobacter sp. AFG20]
MAYANYRYKGHNYVGEVHGEHLIPLAGSPTSDRKHPQSSSPPPPV